MPMPGTKTSPNNTKEIKYTGKANLEVIKEEIQSKKPRKKFLSFALNGLKALKFTAEFGAAVATLTTFIQTLPI